MSFRHVVNNFLKRFEVFTWKIWFFWEKFSKNFPSKKWLFFSFFVFFFYFLRFSLFISHFKCNEKQKKKTPALGRMMWYSICFCDVFSPFCLAFFLLPFRRLLWSHYATRTNTLSKAKVVEDEYGPSFGEFRFIL